MKLTSKLISSVASELLTPEQLEIYQVYRSTLGNKPLIFGGGSADTSDSESLTGVQFVNGTRPGNQAVVDIAKSQVGNVGGQPYWSWFGFTSRVEWCACLCFLVLWPDGAVRTTLFRLSGAGHPVVPVSRAVGRGLIMPILPPAMPSFLTGTLTAEPTMLALLSARMVAAFITVEGNSGDACKVRSYSLTYECIKGYGLMNW